MIYSKNLIESIFSGIKKLKIKIIFYSYFIYHLILAIFSKFFFKLAILLVSCFSYFSKIFYKNKNILLLLKN